MWVYGKKGMHFGCFIAPKVKNDFPQKWVFPKFEIHAHTLPIPFPSPCNNYFNQFLAELNDWVNETRKVVDYLMGSPINIWIFPIDLKG